MRGGARRLRADEESVWEWPISTLFSPAERRLAKKYAILTENQPTVLVGYLARCIYLRVCGNLRFYESKTVRIVHLLAIVSSLI